MFHRRPALEAPSTPASTIGSEITTLPTPDGPKKVLMEEDYLDRMSQIIKRDFFPSLANRETDTPRDFGDDTPRSHISSTTSITSHQSSSSLSLNEFLNRYTSEDNAHFERLTRRDQKKQKKKQPAIRSAAITQNIQVNNQLALPGSSTPARRRTELSQAGTNVYWPYNPKNSLFHPPRDTTPKPTSTINYNSSKYVNDYLFKRPYAHPTSGRKPSSSIGADGRLILNSLDTPTVGGYRFVGSDAERDQSDPS